MMRQVLNLHVGYGGAWVADLSCGHTLPVKQQGPPDFSSLWVASPASRGSVVGTRVDCPKCNP